MKDKSFNECHVYHWRLQEFLHFLPWHPMKNICNVFHDVLNICKFQKLFFKFINATCHFFDKSYSQLHSKTSVEADFHQTSFKQTSDIYFQSSLRYIFIKLIISLQNSFAFFKTNIWKKHNPININNCIKHLLQTIGKRSFFWHLIWHWKLTFFFCLILKSQMPKFFLGISEIKYCYSSIFLLN